MPEERDLIVAVIQLGNLLARRLAPMFEKTNLTPQQWTILNVVAACGPSTLAALARKMIVSKQNMTGMVGRLRAAGYLERNEDPSDLRSARVMLTRRGRTVVEKLKPAYEKWYAELVAELEGFDVTERTIAALIERLEERG
ncbi:MAG TPA: MarR family transcriptional regulator [Thermoanaerobaculia bacterium]|nr:MarR family transcriptional regulator [Thermoanaerobaculia bacterium]